MRLVCPNCEAKYEVPEDAIPETGRDVQCANCGHAWYQMRARAPVADPAPFAPVVAAPVAPAPEPEPATEPEPVVAEVIESAPAEVEASVSDPEPPAAAVGGDESPPEPVADAEEAIEASPAEPDPEPATLVESVEAVAEDVAVEAEQMASAVADATAVVTEPATEAAADAVDEVAHAVDQLAGTDGESPTDPAVIDAAEEAVPETAVNAGSDVDGDDGAMTASHPADGPGVQPAAYAVDESVLAILREEAERESIARRAEAKPLEMQPDLGLDAAVLPVRKPVEVISTEPTEPVEDDASGKTSARRDLLPDVEEINSTLRPSEQPADAAQTGAAEVGGRSSFRSGFLVMMTVAILAAALYIAAPALRNAFPALAGFLDSYMGFVDNLRLQLDSLMRTATMAIGGDAS